MVPFLPVPLVLHDGERHRLAAMEDELRMLGLPVDKSLSRTNWQRRPLTEAELAVHELDTDRFGGALCRALGFEPASASL